MTKKPTPMINNNVHCAAPLRRVPPVKSGAFVPVCPAPPIELVISVATPVGNNAAPGPYCPVEVRVGVCTFASPCPPSSVCGGGRALGVVEESNEVTVSGGNGLNCPGGGVAAEGVSQSVE